MKFRSVLLLAANLLSLTYSASGNAQNPDLLNMAWEFAAQIEHDDADRARMREKTVLAYLNKNDFQAAEKRAAVVENWRRGVLRADIAGKLAEQGRDKEQARKILAAAVLDMEAEQEWRRERILSHIRQANAYLGDPDLGKAIGVESDPAKKLIWEITADLCAGNTAAAVAALSEFDVEIPAEKWDLHFWSARQFIVLSSHEALTKEQKLKLINIAYARAGEVPGWKKYQFQLQAVQAACEIGAPEIAGEWMNTIAPEILALALPDYLKLPLILELAQVAVVCGFEEHVLSAVSLLEEKIPALQSIEQPALLAGVAGVYAQAENTERAEAVFLQSLEKAAELKNRRPRAMAYVEISLALDAAGTMTSASLMNALQDGLKGFE